MKIENAWSWLVKEVYRECRKFDYLAHLHDGIIDAWDRMPQYYVNKQTELMPSGCVRVVIAICVGGARKSLKIRLHVSSCNSVLKIRRPFASLCCAIDPLDL